ncbi:MAG: CvpA family protein [Alkalispirochaetaceae bacterium]
MDALDLAALDIVFLLIIVFTSIRSGIRGFVKELMSMASVILGIAVAVPLLFFHHILSTRQERMMMEVEGGATSLMVALTGVVRELNAPGGTPEGSGARKDGDKSAA